MQQPATTLQGLRDHWQWRPEWSTDRICVLWYLTFETAPELSRQAEQAQALLGGIATVDVVPTAWLHLTLDDVGFADELLPGQVEQVVDAARTAVRDWTAPALTLGPACPMEDAVVLQAGPAPDLVALRELLRGATTGVLGPETVTGLDEFWPHVTLAYLNDACEPGTVMDPLAPVSAAQLVVSAPRLTLAAVTRHDRQYQWTALAHLPLDESVDHPADGALG